MKHILSINGYSTATSNLFGCTCARCRQPKRWANTSVSLITLDGQAKTRRHILFDVGQGVGKSLSLSPYLQDEQARLDWIVLTHWHPDHTNELNFLIQGWQRARLTKTLVPVWARSGTLAWLKHQNPHIWPIRIKPHPSHENLPPGRVLGPVPITLPDLTITPITVSHFGADVAPDNVEGPFNCCAAYVIKTPHKKCVLLWDIDSDNHWLTQPGPAEEAAVELISQTDYLFVDCTTWNAVARRDKKYNHATFIQIQDFVTHLKPRQTILVHLGGHADGVGYPGYGWTDEVWQSEASQIWQAKSLPGTVHIPAIGDEFLL